jgi:WD40 repeat protein
VDLSVRIWSANDASEKRQFHTLFRPQSVLWTRDGRHVVSRANALCAHVWCATNHPDVLGWKAHEQRITTVAFSPDGARALTASDDGSARVWVVRPEETKADPSTSSEHSFAREKARGSGELALVVRRAARISGAWFRPDGRAILTASDDHTACLWNARTGCELREPFVHPDAVTSGAFSTDGLRVLTTCADGVARVWTCGTGDSIALRAPGSARITCANFDPSGAIVATGADDNMVRVFDAVTGAARGTSSFRVDETIGSGIADVEFHPCGGEIAAACGDNAVRFVDVATAQPSRPRLSLFTPRSLCYDANGEHMLVIGRWGGGALRVQSLTTNEPMHFPDFHHTNDITCGSFSADGRYALTASKDATAYVWDARTYQPVTHRTGHSAPITCAAFSLDRDNPRVITGCEDGSVSIWPVDPLPDAEKRVPRDLYGWEHAREERLASPLKYE